MHEANSGISSTSPVRHRKMACSNCRRRKSKCDGATPSCSACRAGKIRCRYEMTPSVAYVHSLQEQIKKLEDQLREARSFRLSTTTGSPVDSTSPKDEASISIDGHGAVSYHNPTSAIHDEPLGNISPEPSLLPTNEDSNLVERRNAEIRRSLVANAATQRRWEERSLEVVSAQYTDIPRALGSVLLKLHWCWFHPSFMFLYRPAFTRDMSLVGCEDHSTAYFSSTLLKVIYAHSCRFIRSPVTFWDQHGQGAPGSSQPFHISRTFTDRLMLEARIALAMETLNPPSIPTIQALLQLSARDVACGRSSQAWLYSGMAFRMAIDLGVHLPTDKLQSYVKSLSPEDIEIRKRLFWSLYAWDKHISLYLGRMPNFLAGTENVPLDFFDDFAETDLWQPYYGPESLHNDISRRPSYTPTSGHVISCFTALCKLCKILSRLMLDLYSPQPVSRSQDKPAHMDPRSFASMTINSDLQAWWTALPSFLRIQPDQIPPVSPPPHITSLNLMYHCTLILLHRPYIIRQENFDLAGVQRSLSICKAATTAIHNLLKMYVNTFGFQHITYMNSYCTYTAATVAIFQLEHSEGERIGSLPGAHTTDTAHTELKFLLEILQHTAPAMPGLYRSIDILKAKIKKIFEHQVDTQLDSLFFGTTPQQQQQQQQQQPSPWSFSPLTPFSPDSLHNSLGVNIVRPSDVTEPVYMQQPPTNSHNTRTDNSHSSNNSRGWAEPLPAFPGQDVFLGWSDLMLLDSEGLSPDARLALMGSNLDPHLSLDHPSGIEGLSEL